MKRSDIPNVITVGRILLVPPIIWVLLENQYMLALVLFLVAGASDGLDGFLAKYYGWTSRLGGLLDPLADKAMLISCYGVLGWHRLIPAWLVALVIVRDLVIVLGAVYYHFRVARLDAEPTLISKLNTLLQIALVLLVILLQAIGRSEPGWVDALVYMVTATILWSGVDYVITWGRRARTVR